MRLHLFFFFLIVLVPSSLAFNCDYFSGFLKEECLSLNDNNEGLIANLIYNSTYTPDHDFVRDYNYNIQVVDAPENVTKYSSGIIKNAWVSLLYVSPSVRYGELFVPSIFQSRTEYNYRIELPPDYYNNQKTNGATCKILYSLTNQQSTLTTTANDQQCDQKQCSFNIDQDGNIESSLSIQAIKKEEYYRWDKYCCRTGGNGYIRYCYKCKYDRTEYHTDSLNLKDSLNVKHYNHIPEVNFEINKATYDTYKGIYTKDNETNLLISLNNSYLDEYEFEYSAEFSKKPYNFLTITAERQHSITQRNFLKENNTLYFKDRSFCKLEYSDFFNDGTKLCTFDFTKEPKVKEFEKVGFSSSWLLLIKIVVFLFVNLLIYTAIKKTWGRILIVIALLITITPVALAVDDNECGLLNLASCLPQKMYDFFISLINAPLQPLLYLVRTLLETPPSIDLFYGVWAIMVYIISLFYGLLFIYSGFQFLFSGHNVIRREMAKEWLKNTVMMIVLVQGSFYLYKLVLELGSVMTSSVLTIVKEQFFLITADNLVNVGLEFIFVSFYVIALVLTVLLLVIRYIIVASGVIFIPIGIFCWFIPPLKSYGKLILHIIGSFIFITFVDAIIILACSMLVEIPVFENVKILVMISCFLIIDVIFVLFLIKAIFKAVFHSNHTDNVAQAVKYIAMFV